MFHVPLEECLFCYYLSIDICYISFRLIGTSIIMQKFFSCVASFPFLFFVISIQIAPLYILCINILYNCCTIQLSFIPGRKKSLKKMYFLKLPLAFTCVVLSHMTLHSYLLLFPLSLTDCL